MATPRLKGEAWYLRRATEGLKWPKDIPLGVYGGEANRAKAQAAANKMAASLDQAEADKAALKRHGVQLATPHEKKSKTPTFREWWAYYKTAYSPDHKADRTQIRDASTVDKHWLPMVVKREDGSLATFGDLHLDELTDAICQQAVTSRRHAKTTHQGRKVQTLLTEDTVQTERRLINAILNHAVAKKKVKENVMRSVGRLRKGQKPATRDHRVLSQSDEIKLVTALRASRPDAFGIPVRTHERYVRFVLFMLEVGIRIDELLNEHFRDNGATIHVRGKFSKERDLALTTTARKLLDDQWKDAGDARSARPKAVKGACPVIIEEKHADETVTRRPCTCGGKAHAWWQNEQRFRAIMAKGCKRAGILHLSPHDLRHTFGHRYLELYDGRIEDLSQILGHATIAVTERHYAYRTAKNIQTKMIAAMESKGRAQHLPATM